jgi:Acetyltransferase (GNAT) family
MRSRSGKTSVLIQFQKGKRFYEGFLADHAHLSVKSLNAFKGRYANMTMGLHLNGKSIGTGNLMRWRGAAKKEYLQTESTGLDRGYRKKGHGIILYMFLIETARILGAKRIYSSRSLNKHSRRMWADKLSRIYDVKKIPGRCRCCGRPFKHFTKPVYYIDLQEK